MHKRIAKFFRLYTQVLNFQVYMLVSHRNMISIYDISKGSDEFYDDDGFPKKETGWVQTIKYDEFVKKMFIKKRPLAERIARVKKRQQEISEVGTG